MTRCVVSAGSLWLDRVRLVTVANPVCLVCVARWGRLVLRVLRGLLAVSGHPVRLALLGLRARMVPLAWTVWVWLDRRVRKDLTARLDRLANLGLPGP